MVPVPSRIRCGRCLRADELVRAGVERKLEIVGEALDRLSRDYPELAPRIPDIARIVGVRNVLAHGDDIVDDEVVWDAIMTDPPDLTSHVETMLTGNEIVAHCVPEGRLMPNSGPRGARSRSCGRTSGWIPSPLPRTTSPLCHRYTMPRQQAHQDPSLVAGLDGTGRSDRSDQVATDPNGPLQPSEVEVSSSDRLAVQRVLALLARLGAHIHEAFISRVDPAIVENPEVLVLATLDVEGRLRPRRIAELTGISPSGVTKLIDRLEGHGLVVRQVGSVPGDRRGTRIVLTPHGQHVVAELAAALMAQMDLVREVVSELQETVGD